LRRERLLQWFGLGSVSAQASERGEDAVLARVDADTVRRAMEALSPMQRACFELVTVRGLSTEEVAAMHAITESTVRQHVFRARGALRDALGAAEAECDE
jgi:RNA polymerase sigma factor (sigma-70 family)